MLTSRGLKTRTDGGTVSRRFFRRFRKLALFVLIQGLVVVLLLEVVGRIADPFGISFYPESARYFDTLIIEEPIGYRNRPGLVGQYWGAPVSVNALGMRDREVGPKTEGEMRVLAMGDSVPFGLGVTYEDSIPFRLEQLLNASRPGTRYRTLNMGVPSYNTEQELIQFESVGLSLEPDVVFLLFTFNDVEEKMWVLDKRKSPIVNMSQRSYAACLLAVLHRKVRQALGGTDSRGVAPEKFTPSHPSWMAVDRALTRINRLCREAAIPFVLFTHFGEVGHPAFGMLSTIGEREGFSVISVNPFDDPRWAGENRFEFQNSVVDSHPNPEGSKLFATMIFEGLERAGVLSSGNVATE